MASKLKPKMLKEFLGDTTIHESSSNGFTSYPRNFSDPNFQNLLEAANDRLPRSRSRSRAAAEAAVSSFQKILNAVKSLQYSSTPSKLPRSISRRLLGKWQTKKKSNSSSNDVVMSGGSKIVVVNVKVKDILRWRSFHHHHHHHHQHQHHHQVSESEEEEERESQPSVLVGPAFDAPSTSDTSVDDKFTVTEEDLPCCRDDDAGKKWEEVVASDSEVGPKEDYHKISSEEDTVQQSPVSILDSPFRDEVSDEENLSTFDQSLANMERTKQRLLQSIQLFESLAGVHDDEETEEELLREEDDTVKAKSRGFCWFERGGEGLKDKKECVHNMEQEGQWSKFEDEIPEIGVELEDAILNDLLDEVLFDLC